MDNEQILNTFANKMLRSVEAIEQFGVEQIPDYIDQVLVYNFYENMFFLCLPIFPIIITLVLFKITDFKRANFGYNKENSDTVKLGCFIAFAVISCLWSLLVLVEFAPKMIKIKVAPKVYIMDYLADKIK